MKKERHTRVTALLMLFSWMLILILVVFWVKASYDAEREVLRKDLGRYFADSKLQVMDSVLILHLIEPMFRQDSSAVMKIRSTGRVLTTVPGSDTGDSIIISATGGKKHQLVYNITVSDTAKEKMPEMAWRSRLGSDSENLTLHSIRLIVGNAVDSTMNDPSFRNILPASADTSLFRKVFLQKLDDQGLAVDVRIIGNGNPGSPVTGGPRILLSDRMLEGTISAEITGFSWLLAGKIVPQLLFSLLLLLMTAGAFLFTYRSLKKQILLNDLRNDFFRNITHELKTPVATVRVALESLRSFDMKKDPAVTASFLDMASMEMVRLDQLIGKVLTISALEEHRSLVNPVSADLKTLVLRVAGSMKPRMDQAGADIAIVAADPEYICLLDELYAEGVVINLLDNCMKYSGTRPSIHIGLSQDTDSVTLTVRDHGPGIPEEFLDRVFEKFFRVPAGDRHNVKGHGLGLTYVWHAMDQHGGSVKAENIPGGGTLFTLVFRKGDMYAGKRALSTNGRENEA